MKILKLKFYFFTAVAFIMCDFGLRAADLTWDADTLTTGPQEGPGVWDTTTNTWWDGANNVTWDNLTPANAIFGGASSGTAGPVTVGASLTINVGNLTFNTPAAGNYNLTPGDVNSSLSFIPSSVITVASGLTVTNTVVFTGSSSFMKAGAGTFWIRPANANLNSGTTIVTTGTLVMGSSGNRAVIPGDLIVTNTGDARLGAANTIANVATVSVSSGAIFEMNGNALGVSGFVLDGGTVTQSGTESLAVSNFDAQSGSIIQNSGATGKFDVNTLTKSTSGSVTLTSRGASAAGGGITNMVVNDGTLILDYTQSSSKLNDSGTLIVNGGNLVLTNGSTTEVVGAITITGGVITNSGGTSKLSVPSGSYDVRTGLVYTVLTGAASLTKTTPGTVVLAAVDTYSGGTFINEGILQLGDGNISGTANSSAINDSTTLVLDPGSTAASISSVISGSGSVIKIGTGTAALTPINSYQGSTTISNGILSIDSDATYGDGTGTLNLSGGTMATTASRSVTTAPVANPINVTADSTVATTSTSSTVDLNFSSSSIGGTAGTLTFSNAAVSGAGVFEPRFTGSGFNFNRPIVIANGTSGTTRLDSYNVAGTTQTFSGSISGTGGFRRNASVSGNGGTTVFSGNNIYSGNTDVNQGVVLVNGSLGLSTVAVGSNGTLGGNGTIAGSVTVAAGGTLAPGAAIGSIGQLTINNSLSLAGNVTVDVNKTGAVFTQDSVAGLTAVTYGGNLIVNATGDALVAGDHFTLFNIGGSGNFTNIAPAPGAGLNWSFNPATGILSVVGANTSPTLSVSQSGNTLMFSWTDASFKLQSQTNSLTTGLGGNWSDYPGGGSSPVNVTIDPANPTVFFRLSQ